MFKKIGFEKILIITVLLVAGVITLFQAYQKNKIENYPIPTIVILRTVDDQDDDKEYPLELKVENADEVKVNDKVVEIKDGLVSTNVFLPDMKGEVHIWAKNQYKENLIDITLTRSETPKEKEVRLAREAKAAKRTEEAEKRKKQEGREERIFSRLDYEINRVYNDPNLEYILNSDALLDNWEKKKTAEVAREFGISVSETEKIYIKVMEKKIKAGIYPIYY